MKKWLFRFGAVVIATLLTLWILEIAVRLAWEKLQGPIIPLSLKTHRPSADPLLAYELIPGSTSFEDQAWYRINFGVMGYDTTQEARLLETKVLAFQPDLIVIGYCLNDIGVPSRERRVLSQYRGYNDFFTTGLSWLDRF